MEETGKGNDKLSQFNAMENFIKLQVTLAEDIKRVK